MNEWTTEWNWMWHGMRGDRKEDRCRNQPFCAIKIIALPINQPTDMTSSKSARTLLRIRHMVNSIFYDSLFFKHSVNIHPNLLAHCLPSFWLLWLVQHFQPLTSLSANCFWAGMVPRHLKMPPEGNPEGLVIKGIKTFPTRIQNISLKTLRLRLLKIFIIFV